jgi:hypothetical protein
MITPSGGTTIHKGWNSEQLGPGGLSRNCLIHFFCASCGVILAPLSKLLNCSGILRDPRGLIIAVLFIRSGVKTTSILPANPKNA